MSYLLKRGASKNGFTCRNMTFLSFEYNEVHKKRYIFLKLIIVYKLIHSILNNHVNCGLDTKEFYILAEKLVKGLNLGLFFSTVYCSSVAKHIFEWPSSFLDC